MADNARDPRIHVIIHQDFETYDSELLAKLKGAQGCVWALGISSTQVGTEYVQHVFDSSWSFSSQSTQRHIHVPDQLTQENTQGSTSRSPKRSRWPPREPSKVWHHPNSPSTLENKCDRKHFQEAPSTKAMQGISMLVSESTKFNFEACPAQVLAKVVPTNAIAICKPKHSCRFNHDPKKSKLTSIPLGLRAKPHSSKQPPTTPSPAHSSAAPATRHSQPHRPGYSSCPRR